MVLVILSCSERAASALLDRPDAESASREQDRHPISGEPESGPRLGLVARPRKARVDGDAGYRDLRCRDPALLEVDPRLVERDEVLLVVVAQPHCVNVEVGDDDPLRAREAPLCPEPRDDLGWEEMRADDGVGPW